MSQRLITLIIIALILGLGVFLFSRHKVVAPTTPPASQEPTDNTQSTQELNKPVDTSDWKTYRNEEYGFEFQYPESTFKLQVIDLGEQIGVYTRPLPKESLIYLYEKGYSIDDQLHQMSIQLNTLQNGGSFKSRYATGMKSVHVNIGGKDGEIFTTASNYIETKSAFDAFINKGACSSEVMHIEFNEIRHPDGDRQSYCFIGCSDNDMGNVYQKIYQSIKFFNLTQLNPLPDIPK